MRSFKIILEIAFWMIASIAILMAAGALIGVMSAPVVGYFATILVLALLPMITQIVRLVRRRRAAAVLGYLEQAVRLNLPLPTILAAAGRSERGQLAYQLMHLRRRLEEGYPLAAALEATVPQIGDRAAGMIEAAERIGQLPHVLHKLTAQRRRAAREDLTSSTFLRAYPLVLAIVLCTSMSLFFIYVLPKYEQIFKDFGTALPAMTVLAIDIARTFGGVLLVIAAVAVMAFAGTTLRQAFHSVGASRGTFIQSAQDNIVWRIPILRTIARDRALADGFDIIAQALRAGVPAGTAIAQASNLGINQVMRQRFVDWAMALDDGKPLHEAARIARMPELVATMLAPAQTGQQAAEVFDFLSRYYATRFSRTAMLLRGAAVPATALFFGSLVCFCAMAMLLPMISLIQSISVPARHVRL